MVRQIRPDAKIPVLCERLRELALQKGPQTKLPTSQELCRMFETTHTTLGNALDILEEQHVLYRKQGSGIYVSPKLYRKSIGIMCYSYFMTAQTSPFWGMFWGLFAREAQRRLEIHNEAYSFHMPLLSPQAELALSEDLLEMIQAKKVHGLLAVGLLSPTYDWLVERGIPNVTFAGKGDVMVCEDTVGRDRLAFRCLAEQGCRHIGYWYARVAFHDQDVVMVPELDYPEAPLIEPLLAEVNLELNPDLVKSWKVPAFSPTSHEFLTYQEQGYRLAMEVFGSSSTARPDGLLIGDDMLTAGAVQALHELGVRVGEDVKIVSHANRGSPALFGLSKYISMVEFDPAEIVQTMFGALEHILSGESPSQSVITVRPILRCSSMRSI